MKIIGFVNQKGGVAKTSSANALANGLAMKGFKVLLIDFDPQGNLTISCGLDTSELKNQVYHWLLKDVAFSKVVENVSDNVDILPSSLKLAEASLELVGKIARETKLKKKLTEIPKNYDYIIIDSNPSLDLLTINVLVAATDIIIPYKPEFFSLEGIESLMHTVHKIKDELNPELKVDGFLTTMFRGNTKSAGEVIEIVKDIAKNWNTKVFESKIMYSVDVADAPSNAKSIYEYKAKSKAALKYLDWVEEYLNDNIKGGKK